MLLEEYEEGEGEEVDMGVGGWKWIMGVVWNREKGGSRTSESGGEDTGSSKSASEDLGKWFLA